MKKDYLFNPKDTIKAMEDKPPTTNLEINAILLELIVSVQSILGDKFTGAYLQGSFALGDSDQDSDVDFIIVVNNEVSEFELSALQLMHARIYELDSQWAKHLEGSYFPQNMLKNPDPASSELLFLDNTFKELIRSDHCNTLVVRWVLREHGITLAGPDPKTLVEPVVLSELRQEIILTMHKWANSIFTNPDEMNNRWYQPYAVLTYCRMLYTLYNDGIASKLAAAEWAKTFLEDKWAGLIQRAWDERPNPSLKVRQVADPDDFKSTLDFIRYSLNMASSDK